MESAVPRRAVFAGLMMCLSCAAAARDEVKIQYSRPVALNVPVLARRYQGRCGKYSRVYLKSRSSRLIDARIRIATLAGAGDVDYTHDLSIGAGQRIFVGCGGEGPFILNYQIVRAEYR